MKNKNSNIVTGFKFAEIADVVFSGVFLKSQISSLKLQDNIQENINDDEYVIVKKSEFKLNENDIIFCKTEYLKELFFILKKECNFNNIKLISHQSDLTIDKKLYNFKPKCISKWYSINIDYEKPDLIPIPLGVSNFHSKNLSQESFNRIEKKQYFQKTKKLMYVNFNPNTNFSHRKNLYDLFKHNQWATKDIKPLKNEDYQKNITKHKFTLAPWGNGIDTHRFWEILYSGSIPITKNHHIYSSFKTVPKILVNKYSDISGKFLELNFEYLKKNKDNFNLKELNFDYWENLICDDSDNIENEQSIILSNSFHTYFRFKADFQHNIKSKLKFFNRIRRFIYRKFNI